MGKIVISSSYKTRKHIAATHCTGFNIGDKQAVEKRFRGRLCKAKMAEKAQFTGVNEHFEAIFNAAEATQIVFQQPARGWITVEREGGPSRLWLSFRSFRRPAQSMCLGEPSRRCVGHHRGRQTSSNQTPAPVPDCVRRPIARLTPFLLEHPDRHQ